MRRGIAAVVCAVVVVAAAAALFVWWAPVEERAFRPFGASHRCVVAVTDDTDFFQFETTAPVYTFMDSLGVRVTKTVWAFEHPDHPPEHSGLTLQDPEYRRWVLAEAARGHEIVLHSATAGHDERETTIAAFDTLRNLVGGEPRLMVFHSVNREAFYWGSRRLPFPLLQWVYRMRTGLNRFDGDDPSSPFYWVDVSRSLVTYVRGYTTDEINTLAVDPSMPYEDPLTPDAPLWCASSNGKLVGEFVRLLSKSNVDKLKRQEGVSIVYTHFASGFAEPSATGRWSATPEAREVFTRCVRDPEVEFAPAGELLDRLRAVQYLEDAARSRDAGSGDLVVLMPPRLLGVLDDISVAPSRIPDAPAGAPADSRVPLQEWMRGAGWEVRAADMTMFDGARVLGARERLRMVLRWLWMSIVSPSTDYESGAWMEVTGT